MAEIRQDSNSLVPKILDLGKDINIIKLAREVAIDHYPIEDIIARYSIPQETWDALNEWPRFKELVDYEKQQWNSALNTNARIRLKSATVIEEWMEEGYALLTDKQQSFASKIELVKLLGKFSGLEVQEKVVGDTAAGRVTINIKIGDTQLNYNGNDDVIDAIPAPYKDEYTDGDDPDTIEYDWDAEFAVDPTEDAEEYFDNSNPSG